MCECVSVSGFGCLFVNVVYFPLFLCCFLLVLCFWSVGLVGFGGLGSEVWVRWVWWAGVGSVGRSGFGGVGLPVRRPFQSVCPSVRPRLSSLSGPGWSLVWSRLVLSVWGLSVCVLV